jgi:hypothetical protein
LTISFAVLTLTFVIKRAIHMIGSYPAETTTEAMNEMLELAGPCLVTLPDGETGERRNWIAVVIENLRTHPDLEVRREGDFSDYGKLLNFRVRRGHRLRGESLHFGYPEVHAAARPVFDTVRKAHSLTDLTFQIGMPTGLGMSMFSMGPQGPLLHRRAFTEAIAREITRIRTDAGDDVLIQLEMPAELAFVAMSPAPLRAAVAAWLARTVAALVRLTPEGTSFGLHLCMGDLAHTALFRMRDAGPVVVLLNALAARWPSGHRLELVHAPLAAGVEPPPLDPAFYARLSALRLPEHTRFVAGLLHEGRTADELRSAVAAVEDALGRPVDLAASCGLGRRDRETARSILRQGAQLSEPVVGAP